MGGVSEEWYPKRGLREGCPSSPPLFNVLHDPVLKDLRGRRKRAADAAGFTPGVPWEYEIDGHLQKKVRKRHKEATEKGKSSSQRATVLGDGGFAHDRTIAGYASEVRRAEPLLVMTMSDWEEK
eukprot:8590053-Pyramimonas_sp.AAC.1